MQWRSSGLQWHCPICTKTCCCTLRECTKNHRHCKAYRYRRKRAQLAETDAPLAKHDTTPMDHRESHGLPLHMQMHQPGAYPGAMFAMLGSAGPHMVAAVGQPNLAGMFQRPPPHPYL